MLIHIKSKGILDECWDQNRTAIVHASFQTCPDLDPVEWIEIKGNSLLAEQARQYYPWMKLVFDAGVLVDIVPE